MTAAVTLTDTVFTPTRESKPFAASVAGQASESKALTLDGVIYAVQKVDSAGSRIHKVLSTRRVTPPQALLR
jgi:hypothetical protein